jgi:hypothetical protein
MANHGFITSRFHFKRDEVLKYLEEINQRRFNGLLKIEDSEYADDAWFISYDDTLIYKHPVGFNIWIESKRKLEHRHTHGWGFYLEVVFSSELGFIYDGMISDECCEERWKPTPKKYPTYRKWLESRYSHLKKSKDKKMKTLYTSLIKDEMSYVPKPFREL